MRLEGKFFKGIFGIYFKGYKGLEIIGFFYYYSEKKLIYQRLDRVFKLNENLRLNKNLYVNLQIINNY